MSEETTLWDQRMKRRCRIAEKKTGGQGEDRALGHVIKEEKSKHIV